MTNVQNLVERLELADAQANTNTAQDVKTLAALIDEVLYIRAARFWRNMDTATQVCFLNALIADVGECDAEWILGYHR